MNFISEFEEALSGEAKRLGCDGVICGHIHHAAMHDMHGVRYINTGDWVESCTAVAENFDGTFEIIRWTRSVRLRQDDAEREETALPDAARSAA